MDVIALFPSPPPPDVGILGKYRKRHPRMGQMAGVVLGREDGSREECGSGGNGEEGWGPELAGSEGERHLRICLAPA